MTAPGDPIDRGFWSNRVGARRGRHKPVTVRNTSN
jgi:hypothetical protein